MPLNPRSHSRLKRSAARCPLSFTSSWRNTTDDRTLGLRQKADAASIGRWYRQYLRIGRHDQRTMLSPVATLSEVDRQSDSHDQVAGIGSGTARVKYILNVRAQIQPVGDMHVIEDLTHPL
jgi:hypothetical protein